MASTRVKIATTFRQSQMINNILHMYDMATDGEREEGESWYNAAAVIAEGLASKHGVDVNVAAGVLAVISPRMQWSRNVVMADVIISNHNNGTSHSTTGVFATNLVKALRILDGEPVDEVLGGNKVNSFYANIVGDYNAVTVDTWAWRVATGMMDSTPQRIGDEDYDLISVAYEEAAEMRNVSPREMQAVTWIVVRNLSRNEK